MRSDIQFLELKNLVDEKRGISYGVVQPGSNVPNGIPIIRVQNINDGEIDSQDIMQIDPEIEKKHSRTRLHGNEVLLTLVGSIGKSVVVPDSFKNWNVARAIAVLPVNEIEPYWLHLCLQTKEIQRIMDVWCTTTVQATLNLKEVSKILIPVPPKNKRIKIISIIRNLDNKIKNLQNQNRILEQTAQDIFKSWFVDFDGVTEFEDSELGKIPKGWKVISLQDFTEKFTTGLNPRKNFVLGSGENYYVTIKNMNNNDIILDDKCDKVDDDAIRKINLRSNLEKNDILLSGVGTIGRVFFIDEKPNNWNINESVFTLRANQKVITPIVIYHLLLSYDFQSYIQANAVGSVQKGIRMSDINNYNFALPNIETLKEMSELPYNILKHIKLIKKNIKLLAETRDTLLPKLMSGEIRV